MHLQSESLLANVKKIGPEGKSPCMHVKYTAVQLTHSNHEANRQKLLSSLSSSFCSYFFIHAQFCILVRRTLGLGLLRYCVWCCVPSLYLTLFFPLAHSNVALHNSTKLYYGSILDSIWVDPTIDSTHSTMALLDSNMALFASNMALPDSTWLYHTLQWL